MNCYPIVRCQHPSRVLNPYTHEFMIVPCGRCSACAVSRSSHLQLWCDLEAQSNEFCMFITLTYANRFIPRAQILDSLERPYGHDLVTSDGEILGTCDISDTEIDRIKKRTYLFGDIPYLRKEDLQKFLKRFRYYVSKASKAKVRYFAVGEYGPVHYRPHYHILLYFSDKAVLEVCEQAVLQAWPFGRVDVQLSKGSCSQYVAGYVNSTCALPKVYLSPAVRPFQVHSTKLGFRILQGERKEIYETSVDDFIRRSIEINGHYREFSLWRSFYAYYYPKCKGFASKSTSQRIDSYRVYGYARQAFPECESVLDLSKSIAACAYFFGTKRSTFRSYERTLQKVITYFDEPRLANWSFESEDFNLYVQRVCLKLLLSKHFLTFVCDNQSYAEIVKKVHLIENFYSRLDYLHLRDFFQTQSLFFENHLFGDDELQVHSFENVYYPYFYDNVMFNLEDYKTTSAYRLMDAESAKLYYDRIKHKELYDRTGIFLSDD